MVLFEIQPTATTGRLLEHLQTNRLYYSQAIWSRFDAGSIGALLARLSYDPGGGAKPLVTLVDPTPVTLTANYLVFRLTAGQA